MYLIYFLNLIIPMFSTKTAQVLLYLNPEPGGEADPFWKLNHTERLSRKVNIQILYLEDFIVTP